jgi:hypothetical protein
MNMVSPTSKLIFFLAILAGI